MNAEVSDVPVLPTTHLLGIDSGGQCLIVSGTVWRNSYMDVAEEAELISDSNAPTSEHQEPNHNETLPT
eukprot:1150138-Pelagomonas_calceolata.AAC.13